VVNATVPWSSPFSNPAIGHLQQMRYALRFPLSKPNVEITYSNPGVDTGTLVLPVVAERDSFSHASTFFGVSNTVLPVEFRMLTNDMGYISINSFFDNQVLTIQLWERAITYLNNNGVPGLILDMRHNSGGSGWLADQMAAYFFDHRIAVGNTALYDPVSDDFFFDPTDKQEMIPPRPELQYTGSVAILIGPGCASACEFFSYDMTLEGRAAIVGQYSSDGAGGSVEQFVMPEGIYTQMTIGRALDGDGNIHLEGQGVSPTVQVPISLETIQAEAEGSDPVLDAGETFLAQELSQ
jgi:C-terminal processing protease CtpA/Prc